MRVIVQQFAPQENPAKMDSVPTLTLTFPCVMRALYRTNAHMTFSSEVIRSSSANYFPSYLRTSQRNYGSFFEYQQGFWSCGQITAVLDSNGSFSITTASLCSFCLSHTSLSHVWTAISGVLPSNVSQALGHYPLVDSACTRHS